MGELARKAKTLILLVFIVSVFAGLIYTRINAYQTAPTLQPSDFSDMPPWEIPLAYLWDYFSHGWICLLFAFVTAGLVYTFLPKHLVMKHLQSSNLKAYLLSAAAAPLLAVCSCTMIPLFGGILYAGAGIGPAITFLLMAPSANILTILLTGEILSWQLAGARIIASLITALAAGVIIANTPWGKHMDSERVAVSPDGGEPADQRTLYERLREAMDFSWYLAKTILPIFLVGLIAVGYVQAYLPEDLVAVFLTGPLGIVVASVIGGPLYTPTLVEIVLGRGLVSLGMTGGPTLSWLMGQPYDIPNMVSASRIVKWRVVATYALTAWVFSMLFGLTYGLLIGSL